MIFKKEDVENWLQRDVFKNHIIAEKKGDIQIENLILDYSNQVANHKMKYKFAVKSLQEQILKNINSFEGNVRNELKIKKIKLNFRKNNGGENPTQFPMPKSSLKNDQTHSKSFYIKQYDIDGVDFEHKIEGNYNQNVKIRLNSFKEKFTTTRDFTCH